MNFVTNHQLNWWFQTVDKVPGLRRGFSSVVINISIIFPLFIKKKFPLSTRKLSGTSPYIV